MKSQISKFMHNEDGFAITILTLLIFPVLLVMMVSNTEITRINRTTNRTIQYALDRAVRESASMIDQETQAFASPRIDHTKALERFTATLFYNLKTTDTGAALNASSLDGAVTYWLAIYNGSNDYYGYGDGNIKAYVVYTNVNGFTEKYENSTLLEFPRSFGLSSKGIDPDDLSKESVVKIESPSVIAVINVQISSATGLNNPVPITRWSIGRVVSRGNVRTNGP